MKKINLTEKDLTKIIERIINEQGIAHKVISKLVKDPKPGPPSERNKFLEAYSELQDKLYNMYFLDKQDISSHDADKIILGFLKNKREIDNLMKAMCRQYDIAESYFNKYYNEDEWIFNE